MSGERTVKIGDSTYTLFSRYRNQPGNHLAAEFFVQQMNKLGLTVQEQNYSASGRNIYAVQNGTTVPDSILILCTHYDSMPVGSPSPGADDNASGSAAVLEAARVLSQFPAKYTIYYCWWDEEEQGLWGSAAFVGWAAQQNMRIKAVVNVDMIGWDSNNDGVFLINTRNLGISAAVADLFVYTNTTFQIGLTPQLLNPGSGSDNLPFWYYGFSAIGIEEDCFNDWNAHYHTVNDRINAFNLNYFNNCSRLIILGFAELAGINPAVAIEQKLATQNSFRLLQNYPNPFNPSTTIEFYLEKPGFTKIAIFDATGRKIETIFQENLTAGLQRINYNGGHLASGIYVCRVKCGDVVSRIKMILMR